MASALVVLVLAASFACTFALMWGIQRLGGFADPSSRATAAAGWPTMPAAVAPVGPDDDVAFLQELRRRIDRGHFRS